MLEEMRDRLVATIYDAATGAVSWDEVPVALSRAMNTLQSTVEIHDPYAGFTQRYAPLCDPAYRKSYRDYYGRMYTLARRTEHLPVGALFDSKDLVGDREVFGRSIYYNEWWLPQGVGGATVCANFVRDGHATAIVTTYKPFAIKAFTEEERATFALAVRHLVRAAGIYRRLRMAETRQAVAGADAPDAFVVLDRQMRILLATEATRATLHRAGLVSRDGAVERIVSPNGALERLAARPGTGDAGAGSLDFRAPDGARLEVTVIPLPEREGEDWLAIDRPAALLMVGDPAERERARIARLVARHGLTPAEAAVAVEIARGDGRTAAGARLGIRETTVRSHLSAVFDKLGIHRQAELVRFVAEA